MAVAIPLLPPLCGVATSQTSQVLNGQVQLGDVTANQTLNINAVSDQTTAVSTATGNAFSGAVESNSVNVDSTQSMQGSASAHTILNVITDAGAQVSLTDVATGNAGESDALGGGTLTGTFRQTTGNVLIRADDQIEGETAQAGDVSENAQAIANTQGLGTTDGAVAATVTQSSAAATEADGGAILQYSPGTSTFSALAVSNNVTATGTGNATQTLNITQSMTGDHTQASRFIAYGQGQEIDNTTTATANNVSISNSSGGLNVVTNQDNESYVRSQAETTAFEFGTVSTTAMGVGNSVVAAETGSDITLNNTQTNGGAGIDVLASSGGSDGYDIGANATAMGNAVTGYACTVCGGRMTVRNNQTNSADVGAATTIGVDSSARSATGVATAVGNSGTFYVSSPGG